MSAEREIAPKKAIDSIRALRVAAEDAGSDHKDAEEAQARERQAMRKLFRLLVGRHPSFKELQSMASLGKGL